ncbi:hypothetical protein MHU86_14605 [Fragilaria crotonensis]|nr:hypothetical protein MHU86_14605 [Fragilaria crotonensis]
MVSLVQLPRVAIYLIMFVCHGEAFVHHSLQRIRHVIATVDGAALYAKSTKPKKKSAASIAGVKGFGGMSTPSSGKDVNMDRSKDALAFYDFLEKNGAGDNLKRAALGYFPLPDGTQLRGVVALRDMKKGDVMIRIPYEIAINLGLEGEDPTMPGLSLLKQYCNAMNGVDEPNGVDHTPYYRMLPEYKGSDCLGSTDFFSDEALEALQAPMVVTETLKRRERTKKGFESIEGPATTWIDGEPMTEQHLRWAVWLITSRVLTVAGPEEENRSYRLMIPFLDMCNHDRSSPHVLTGRAVPGGELKVVAGAPVQAGEQINICYGGGVAGNDRFLQDYGFLDSDVAFNIVAQQLLGKKRILEGANAGRTISSVDRDVAIERLRMTSMLQDQDLLEKETDPAVKSAILYRLGVKKALSKVIEIE